MTEEQKLELLKLNEKILNLLKLCDDDFYIGCRYLPTDKKDLTDITKQVISELLNNTFELPCSFESELEFIAENLERVKSHLKQQAKKLNYEYEL